jgi:hypothetical protein
LVVARFFLVVVVAVVVTTVFFIIVNIKSTGSVAVIGLVTAGSTWTLG